MKNKVPTGAIECGIIQLSAEFVCPKLYRDGNTAVKGSLERFERGKEIFDEQNNPRGTVFDKYALPREDVEWNEEAGEVFLPVCQQ